MTVLEKVTFQNWSTLLFDGFYESNLYNSDVLYNDTVEDYNMGYLEKNEEYDIEDWDGFTTAVSNGAVEIIDELLGNDEVLSNLKFVSLSSPKYYNFSTDRLNIDMDVNVELLSKFCFETNKDSFDKYLKDTFTSYDGFISFVSNNIKDFKNGFDWDDRDKCLQVMIEYYLLCQLNNTTNHEYFDCDNNYQSQLYDWARDCIYDYRTVVKC